ncbi:hypothetical protein Pcinc_013200 [Petrolisthes cinctipes]|uniref:Uncharacterized protein n=1 Tax=Petrolisthes cinctipes TaxID=88211 RepID=A0AAE1KQL9_PETCI|nr:hypothetical protein Pcinc_013200 [Petrolisthes cinctipes]
MSYAPPPPPDPPHTSQEPARCASGYPSGPIHPQGTSRHVTPPFLPSTPSPPLLPATPSTLNPPPSSYHFLRLPSTPPSNTHLPSILLPLPTTSFAFLPLLPATPSTLNSSPSSYHFLRLPPTSPSNTHHP